jgi:hypothetical protein
MTDARAGEEGWLGCCPDPLADEATPSALAPPASLADIAIRRAPKREATPRGGRAVHREGSLHALDRGRLARAVHEDDHPPWRSPGALPSCALDVTSDKSPENREAHAPGANDALGLDPSRCQRLGRLSSRSKRLRVLGGGLRVVRFAEAHPARTTRRPWIVTMDHNCRSLAADDAPSLGPTGLQLHSFHDSGHSVARC